MYTLNFEVEVQSVDLSKKYSLGCKDNKGYIFALEWDSFSFCALSLGFLFQKSPKKKKGLLDPLK